MTNVLLLIPALHIGGAERVVASLCKSLDRSRFNVTVCHIKTRGSIGEELVEAGFEVVGIPKPRFPFEAYLSGLKIRRIVRERAIDLIHSHCGEALVDASLCRMLTPGVKLVHTFHFGNYPHLNRNDLLMERLCWRVPDRLVAVGNRQCAAIQETYGIPEDRIQTIYNGVEKKTSRPDHDILGPYLEEGRVIIGSISTLIEQKGITYLLDTAAILKERAGNFIFLVVGDGPLRAELERKCSDLGLQDKVRFLGWVEDDASRMLPAFDIFFQPSLWEANSIVTLEAMAAGKPIVATSTGENPYIVIDGTSGFTVEPRDTAGMAEKLELLVGNADSREEMGRNAAAAYDRKYRIEFMLEEHMRLYSAMHSS
jgi:glycosyltransferase involved in cell wall biosynthesis